MFTGVKGSCMTSGLLSCMATQMQAIEGSSTKIYATKTTQKSGGKDRQSGTTSTCIVSLHVTQMLC